MIRELSAVLCVALLAGPALAQDTAAEAPADAATAEASATDAAAPAGEEDDDEDDDTLAATAGGAATEAQHHDYGPSGIMTRTNRADLAPLTLASGKPVAAEPYMLKSGGYYRMKIIADGSQELALSGGDFFRAVWINEIVVNDIEIRPLGVHSIEFDAAGEAEISFIALMPGRYTLSIPGSSGETQQAIFNIQ